MQLPVCGDPRVLGSVLFSPGKNRVEVFANMSEAKNESASGFVFFGFFFFFLQKTRKKSPSFNWRRKDVRGSPTCSGKLIRMSCIKAFERGIASTLNNLAEVFDAMTIEFISFFLFVSQGAPGPSGVFESDLTKYVSSPGSRADRE